ncbi:MAG: hypothetical protein WCL50_08600 [Spirochaetota bacterium]
MYRVTVKKDALKKIAQAPESIRILFDELAEDLEAMGPIQKAWPNFSPLGRSKYHCLLAYSWVACWYNESESIDIEVYYAGSREDAPY